VDELTNTILKTINTINWLTLSLQKLQGFGTLMMSITVIPPDTGGMAFGGSVTAGGIYEILEGNLPFELFESGDRTFFLPNRDGEITSPLNNMSLGGLPELSRMAGIGGAVTNNNLVINVPVTFENVSEEISDDQLNRYAEQISNRVGAGVATSGATLTDKLNRKGVI
jgi:hypothetical protein